MSERRANLEKDIVRADLAVVPGKADTVGRESEDDAHPPRRGSGGSMYIRKALGTREAPWRGQGWPTGRPRGTGQALWGGGEVRSTDEAG